MKPAPPIIHATLEQQDNFMALRDRIEGAVSDLEALRVIRQDVEGGNLTERDRGILMDHIATYEGDMENLRDPHEMIHQGTAAPHENDPSVGHVDPADDGDDDDLAGQ